MLQQEHLNQCSADELSSSSSICASFFTDADDEHSSMQARHFLNSNPDSNCSHSQATFVYKLLDFAKKDLYDDFRRMPADRAKREYRKIVKHVHPDKNCHPLSKEAFQKVQSAFECALGKQPLN